MNYIIKNTWDYYYSDHISFVCIASTVIARHIAIIVSEDSVIFLKVC